jgi:LytS/YehU family sensor histidine kinase
MKILNSGILPQKGKPRTIYKNKKKQENKYINIIIIMMMMMMMMMIIIIKKNKDLEIEICRMWQMKVTNIPMMVGALLASRTKFSLFRAHGLKLKSGEGAKTN